MMTRELNLKLAQAKLYNRYNKRADDNYNATVVAVDEKGKRIVVSDKGGSFEMVYDDCIVSIVSDEPVRALAMLFSRWNLKLMNLYGEIQSPFLDVKEVTRLMRDEGLRVMADTCGRVFRVIPGIQGFVVEPDGTVVDRLPANGRYLPESVILSFHGTNNDNV